MKHVWYDIKESQNQNSFFVPILLILVTIVLPLGVNNATVGILVLTLILNFKKLQLTKSFILTLPIVLFLWMVLSYFWTIDESRTLKAISKEIALFILPITFLVIPSITTNNKQKLLKYYSYSIVILVLYFLSRAIIRYFILNDNRVFFYHGEYDDDFGLVPKTLNAIHISIYVSLAFFYFFTQKIKSKKNNFLAALLLLFVMLLSSKNIIVIFILLLLSYIFFYSKVANKMRLRNVFLIITAIGILFSFGKIKERFLEEFKSNIKLNIGHNINTKQTEQVNYISVYNAWNNEKFSHNDYFSGTAFRAYQTRMFLEFLEEEPIYWKGFGLNASKIKLQEKEKKYNLYPGYGNFNFHNQYLQNFAELGIIGLFLLLLLLFFSFKKAIKTKDFMYIAFTLLMISVFLTESFLWRQRGVMFFTLFYCLFAFSKTTTQPTS